MQAEPQLGHCIAISVGSAGIVVHVQPTLFTRLVIFFTFGLWLRPGLRLSLGLRLGLRLRQTHDPLANLKCAESEHDH